MRLRGTQQPVLATAKRLIECNQPCTDRKCHVALKQKKHSTLRENDYSVAATTQAKRRSELPTRQLQIQSAEATTQSVRDPGMPTRQSRSESSSPVSLKLPHRFEELHRIIARVVRKLGFSGQVRLVYTQGANLKRR